MAFGDARDAEEAVDRALAAAQRLHASDRREDVEEAIAILRSTLDRPALHPDDLALVELFLGMFLVRHSELPGATTMVSDLDEAVTVLDRASSTGTFDTARRATGWLGKALDRKAQVTGDLGDLDLAITVLDLAAQMAAAEAPTSLTTADRYGWLGSALYRRWLLTGDVADLHRAVGEKRRAIAVTTDERTRASELTALGVILLSRWRVTSDTASLEEAVDLTRRSLAIDPSDSEAHAVLGRALISRYQHSGQPPDLAAATRELEQALDLLPPHKQGRGPLPGELAAARLLHARLYGDPRVLDEAIALHRRVLDAAVEERSLVLANLGAALVLRHEWTGDVAVLDEAIAVFADAADSDPTRSRASARRRQGDLLARRHAVTHDPADLAAAQAIMCAVALTDAPIDPSDRLAAAIDWGRIAAEREAWNEARSAYALSMELLADVSPPELWRSDQEARLAGVGPTASDAAAVELRFGDVPSALRSLERGRGILLSTALSLEPQLAELDAAHPDLAQQLRQVQAELDVSSPDTDARHAAGQRWLEAVRQVRQRPGFADFLRPASTTAGPADGAVVVLNASPYRCDALVVEASGNQVVPLPGVNLEDVVARALGLSDAVALAENRTVGLVARMTAQDTVRATLAWLWDTVAAPVLDALGIGDAPGPGEPWPRIWWSPTGPLNRLPVHAAGHDGGPSVLDRVVSSYATTVHALAQVRERGSGGRWGRRLVVAVEETPGYPPLPATRREAEALSTHPDATLLVGPRATRENVLHLLPSHDSVHFACHSHSDPTHPSTSHLALYDQTLSVVDIERLRLTQAGLAFLSACSTAHSGPHLVDEAVHLGSAFTLAGFRHVVATLWPVDDDTAADLARSFYRNLAPGTGPGDDASIALALHHAVREARSAHARLPSRWAAHIHTGP